MSHFLDTNICIRYLNNSSPGVRAKLDAFDLDKMKIPSVVAAELLYDAAKSARRERNLPRFRLFLQQFEIAYFDYAAAEMYGDIRSALERQGARIGWNDLLIAAIVKANGGVLVTNNTREFSRVDGLALDDWTMD